MARGVLACAILLACGSWVAAGKASKVRPVGGHDSPLGPESLDELIRTHDQIESVEVTYVTHSMRGDAMASRHRVAQHNELRFADNSHFSEVIGPELDVNHIRQYFTGHTFDALDLHARIFETSVENAKTEIPWKLRVDFYLSAVGWWPQADAAPPDELEVNPFRPLRHLRDDPTVEYSLEDGRYLVLKRPNRDCVWLDQTRGGVVAKRELYTSRGELVCRLTCSKMEQVDIDENRKVLWPMQLSMHTFQPGQADVANDVSVTVEAIKFNEVDASVFDSTLPPGTMIQDRDTGAWYLLPGGSELLDETAAKAREVLRLRRQSPGSAGTTSRWRIALVFVPAAVVIGLLTRLLLRSRRD